MASVHFKGKLIYSWVGLVQVCANMRPLVDPLPIPRMVDERIWNDKGQRTTIVLWHTHEKHLTVAAIFQKGSDPKLYFNSS